MVEYRIGELFCGAGGLGKGADLATIQVDNEAHRCKPVWGIDNNPWACKTYEENLKALAINHDIRGIEFGALADIDGLLFGFPCNDYSLVGEHRGLRGDFGPLYKYGVKAIEAHNPKWFLAENVGGLASANDGQALVQILRELKKAGQGYRLTPHLYHFEKYGVPQKRHRIIIVGIREDQKQDFRVPAPTHANRYVTAMEALDGVEEVLHNNERTRHPQRTIDFLTHIPEGENAWYEGIPQELRLKVKGYHMSGIYRRLHRDKPSPTVTARGGGGTHGYHWEEPRALTNRERARLQTFPDSYIFHGPKEQVRSQIGMAVPPLGAKVVVEAILKTLAGVAYDSIDANWILDLTAVD